MAPTRKSLGFLTLRKTSLNRVKLKDVSFVHNLSDFSAKVNRRQSMRNLRSSTNRHVGTNLCFVMAIDDQMDLSGRRQRRTKYHFIRNQESIECD